MTRGWTLAPGAPVNQVVMKPHSYFYAALLAIASVVSQGAVGKEASACSEFPPRSQYNPPDASTEGCQCGSGLKNVVITIKSPFRLQAACNLRWVTHDGYRPVNLSSERVTFDSYTNGDLPHGELLLVGEARLPGTLRYEPGPGGEFWFALNHSVGVRGPVEGLLGGFKLYKEHSPSELRVPTSLRRAECWTADAMLEVSNIWLLVGGTDEAGAYPSKYKILGVGGHRPCQ